MGEDVAHAVLRRFVDENVEVFLMGFEDEDGELEFDFEFEERWVASKPRSAESNRTPTGGG